MTCRCWPGGINPATRNQPPNDLHAPILRVDEGRLHLACQHGQSTCPVVEMQMRAQDMGNLLGINAGPAQPVLQA